MLTVNLYRAAIGEVDTREHVHEGSLPAAILAKKRQNLPTVYVEVYVVVCLDLSKRFAYASHPHGWCF
jgi:hypothetical protein